MSNRKDRKRRASTRATKDAAQLEAALALHAATTDGPAPINRLADDLLEMAATRGVTRGGAVTALVLAADWLSRGEETQTPCYRVVAEMAHEIAYLESTGQMEPCGQAGALRLVPTPKG